MIGKLLCRFGRHKMCSHTWPLGIGKLPYAVVECERCGTVEEWAGAWDSVVCIGRWSTYEAFQKAHGREECKHLCGGKYCPECGEKIS